MVGDKSVYFNSHIKIQIFLFVLSYEWILWKYMSKVVPALRSLPNWFFGFLDRKFLQVNKQTSLICLYPQLEDWITLPHGFYHHDIYCNYFNK